MLRLLLAMEKFLYQHVDRIIANATHFKDYLLNLGIARGKICLISDWADGEFIHPMSSHNAVRANWGLGDDFVILYSGNMGYSSDLETVMRAAHLLKDLQGVKFVLVGDGVKLEKLKSMRAEFGLSNVQFEPLQPRCLLPDVLACANVALVTLSEAGGRASTQGKLYSIMAAGRAVVAVSSTDHDIRRIVEEQNCGWWSPAGDAALLALLLRKLVDEHEQVVIKGIQARQSFDEHYSLDVCTRQFEDVFMQLMQTRASG